MIPTMPVSVLIHVNAWYYSNSPEQLIDNAPAILLWRLAAQGSCFARLAQEVCCTASGARCVSAQTSQAKGCENHTRSRQVFDPAPGPATACPMLFLLPSKTESTRHKTKSTACAQCQMSSKWQVWWQRHYNTTQLLFILEAPSSVMLPMKLWTKWLLGCLGNQASPPT